MTGSRLKRSGKSLRKGLSRPREMMPRRRVLKLTGVALALIVMFTPLFFWPAGEAGSAAQGRSKVTITIPPVAVVSTDSTDTAGLGTGTGTGTTGISSETTVPEGPVEITIAAVGDVTTDRRIRLSVFDPETGQRDFRPVLSPVSPYLEAADYTVCNLETPLAGPEAGYNDDPLVNSPDSLAEALASVGVDLATTANSHSLDMDWQGLVGTLDRLDRAGIAHVGTYRSLEEKSTPFVVDIAGIQVAFLNYTAGLNGREPPAARAAYAVNTLDVDAVAKEAMTARMWGADVVIALLHFGNEYSREPSDRQSEVAEGSREVEGLLSRGVDVILGAHSHMVQPIVKVLQYSAWRARDTYVAYSLGNFLSGERWRYSDSGIIAYVHIAKDGLRTRVTGISYLPVYMQMALDGDDTYYRILPVFPGLVPDSDADLEELDENRMDQVWEELSALLYRPDEGIVPFNPFEIRTEP